MDAVSPENRHFSIGDAEDALEALARYSGDCIKLIDLDGRIVRWNAACEELYGWSAAEVTGRSLPHIPPELRLRVLSDVRRVGASGQIAEREGEAMRADGSRIVMRMNLIPVVDDDGHAAGVISTSRELAGDGRMDRRRDEFLAYVSRRLRDPLAAVLGAAQLLARPEILSDSERRDSTIESIVRQAQDASMLLEDMLVISQVNEGRLVLQPEPLDLGSLVSQAVAEADPASRGFVEFDPSMRRVQVDRRRMKQAMSALLENAAHRATGPEAVGVSVFQSGDDAVIEVADDGMAPTPRERDTLYAEFGATDGVSPSSFVEPLGIHLARSVAEAHGGGLNLSALKNGGAVYALFVPMEGQPTGGSHE